MWVETLEADFERLLGTPPDGRLVRIDRLVIALRRLDRYANFGQGQLGAGLHVAQQLMEAQAQDLAELWDDYWRAVRREKFAEWEPAAAEKLPRIPTKPRHLGYFVPELLRIGRKWRRTHRPALQERRRREQARRVASTISEARAGRRA